MRSKFKFAILIASSALLFSACSTKETTKVDMDKARTDIQALEDAYAAGEKAKDANAVAAYYAPDAISYHNHELPASGAAIKDSIAKRLAKDTTGNTYVYKVVDLFGEGDMLVEIGSWSSVNPAGVEVDKGYYMTYFQKRDGKYLAVRDMSVSTNPAKKPM